jgi:glycosyltransferase 2 family protein
MLKKILHLLIGILVAAVFVWLSVREVDTGEVLKSITETRFWWVIPFAMVVLLSNFLRAERWKMVLDDETGGNVSRRVVFSGLMYSLSANILIPRAGEVLRAVYVARHTGIETTRLFGTVILERLIDLLIMLFMLLVTVLLLVTDQSLIEQVFGAEGADYIRIISSGAGLLIIGAGLVVVVLGFLWLKFFRGAAGLGWKNGLGAGQPEGPDAWRSSGPGMTQEQIDTSQPAGNGAGDSVTSKPRSMFKSFVRGLISLRNLRNWPLFILYSVLIWAGYVVMSLLPFWAFGFIETLGFGWEQAFVITVVGAVGVMLPSPGGIGTYHYLVQQALVVLYGVPVVAGLAYATVNHLANLLTIIVVTAVVFMFTSVSRPNKEEEQSIPFTELMR